MAKTQKTLKLEKDIKIATQKLTIDEIKQLLSKTTKEIEEDEKHYIQVSSRPRRGLSR